MPIEQTILLIVAMRESIRLITDLVDAFQASNGISDERMARVKADAAAAHSGVQNTR